MTLKSVDVYYAEGVEPTEKPTEAPTEPPTEEPTEPFVPMYGDVNLDGDVDIMDVILLNKYLLGRETLSDNSKTNADVNVNKKWEADDSLNILKCVVELIQQSDFPIK